MYINGEHIVTGGKRGVKRNRTYAAWSQCKQRCRNPNNPNYADYGGRGITVALEWDDFRAFYADMGPRPSDAHTLDRIDNSKGYMPGNCRWATRKEQSCNTRACNLITYNGITDSMMGWSKRLGGSARLVQQRIEKLGWPPIKAVSTPARPMR